MKDEFRGADEVGDDEPAAEAAAVPGVDWERWLANVRGKRCKGRESAKRERRRTHGLREHEHDEVDPQTAWPATDALAGHHAPGALKE